MDKKTLFGNIQQKSSFLCVGLDTDLAKIPSHLLKEQDPIFAFNREIIDKTADFAVAYKPNIAFYEALGPKGWESLQKTLDYIPKDIFTIADAKRGDIGNTSKLYAKAFFEQMDFDSITVAPYMGQDSVSPFLEFEDKWVILLALTSNGGSSDFQVLETEGGKPLFQQVLEKSQRWGSDDNLMYVVGATNGAKIAEVRKYAPDHFFLVPGVGAQGGSLEEVAKYGMNSNCGLLVNSSRGIIYASDGADFGDAARAEASKLQQEMARLLEKYG
ncbi:orotidine-5'-phosphate decarboxylase [Echinicola vietnamensis]|uniref:Orotidine-5'-phosphate decarboxylase n=1 Tax=Echinicola vietnamensis (strain DSM 17526 / LMG 23754 / KMM 6221) TaxID=926556 RepID=L0FZA1_ECHVK|nr:orotidine-5'-phosphate decarboxylase [Echinicola vietnamensis]AGA78061.1 orotidine 5''-phosphate decarboxylase, subfamily 2 [Echinicola vietnamensis DSM 17526]